MAVSEEVGVARGDSDVVTEDEVEQAQIRQQSAERVLHGGVVEQFHGVFSLSVICTNEATAGR